MIKDFKNVMQLAGKYAGRGGEERKGKFEGRGSEMGQKKRAEGMARAEANKAAARRKAEENKKRQRKAEENKKRQEERRVRDAEGKCGRAGKPEGRGRAGGGRNAI